MARGVSESGHGIPAEIGDAIRSLDVAGRPLCIHASMRSFTPRIDADALLGAFLDAGASVLVPTFTYEMSQPPPDDDRPERTGVAYAPYSDGVASDASFSTTDDVLSLADMGQFPRAVLAREGRIRGRHPLNSFTAVGPLAPDLIAGQTPDDVYAPLDSLGANDGIVLLIGVTYTSMTLIHLAETRAGRRLFRRWARLDGKLTASSVGSCSAGFRKFEPVLDPMAVKMTVCGSLWRALPSVEALMTATGVIHRDPPMTHCERDSCARCPDAIAGGPILYA